MLRLFKSNNPAVGIYLLVYTLILTIPVLFITPLPQKFIGEPLSRAVIDLVRYIGGDSSWWRGLLAVLLVIIQAMMVKNLATKYKLFDQPTYVPSMLYVLTVSLFTDFLQFTPALMANTVIILFLDKAFESLHRDKALLLVYDMGFLAAIAALFYFPTIVLLPVLFISLIVIRPFIWREWVLAWAGFLTPYFLAGTYYFWFGKVGWFIESYFLNSFRGVQSYPPLAIDVIIFGSIVLMMTLGALFLLQLNYMRSSIQFRKFSTVMMWLLFALVFCYFLQPSLNLAHFVVITVPVSFMLTYFFLNLKYARIAEALHIVVFLLVIFFHYSKLIV